MLTWAQFMVLLLAGSAVVAQESRSQVNHKLAHNAVERKAQPLQPVDIGTTRFVQVFNTSKLIRLSEDKKPQKRHVDLHNVTSISLPALGSAIIFSDIKAPIKTTESSASTVYAEPRAIAQHREVFSDPYFDTGNKAQKRAFVYGFSGQPRFLHRGSSGQHHKHGHHHHAKHQHKHHEKHDHHESHKEKHDEMMRKHHTCNLTSLLLSLTEAVTTAGSKTSDQVLTSLLKRKVTDLASNTKTISLIQSRGSLQVTIGHVTASKQQLLFEKSLTAFEKEA